MKKVPDSVGLKRKNIPKRDPNVGIFAGRYAFSDDPAERREGLLMQAEHTLVSVADAVGTLEDEGCLTHGKAIKKRMQELYDLIMDEFNTYLRPTDGEGRFMLAPKPVDCRYTPPGADAPESEPEKREAA